VGLSLPSTRHVFPSPSIVRLQVAGSGSLESELIGHT
jgi:hypothetical protein